MAMFHLLLMVFFIQGCAAIQCKDGWIHHDHSCYLVVDFMKVPWVEAQDHCRYEGGMLVEINDVTENNFLKNYLGRLHESNDFWIGGTDIATEGEWKWSVSGYRFGFTNWGPGEPSNAGGYHQTEECAELYHNFNFQWNDENCALKKNNFICEIDEYLHFGIFG